VTVRDVDRGLDPGTPARGLSFESVRIEPLDRMDRFSIKATSGLVVVVVGQIRRDQQKRPIVEKRLDHIGDVDWIHVPGEQRNYWNAGSHDLEKRKLDLERVLSFVRSRRVDDERRHQCCGHTGSVDRYIAERGLEVVDAWEGESGEPHIVRRTEHDDPPEVFPSFEQTVPGGGDRARVHITGVRDDKNPQLEIDHDAFGSGEMGPDLVFEAAAVARVEGAGDGGATNCGTHGLPP
jgi:hypothetical protein